MKWVKQLAISLLARFTWYGRIALASALLPCTASVLSQPMRMTDHTHLQDPHGRPCMLSRSTTLILLHRAAIPSNMAVLDWENEKPTAEAMAGDEGGPYIN